MNVLKNKLILQLFMSIIIVALGTVAYTGYHSSQKYIAVQNNATLTSFLPEFESLLSELGSERIRTADYLVTQSKSMLEQLKETRASVDIHLRKLDKSLRDKSLYMTYSQQMKMIVSSLQEVRKDVDDLSDDYRDIFFHAYYTQSVGRLLEILKEILKEMKNAQKSEEIKDHLLIYEKYTVLKENSRLENTGIYFVLLGSRKMCDADIKLWNELMDKDTLPQFDILINSSVSSKIEALCSVEEFDAMVSRERNMILKESEKGEYSVSVLGWLNQINKKIDYFTEVQVLLHTEIQKKEQTQLLESRNHLIVYGLVFLGLLLLLFRLFVIYGKLNKNKVIPEETLKDIALVFNKNQQEELKRLIHDGKVEYIYKFLIKAILDANKTKDLFLANMSHEIRTPLNGILGFTQLLKESDATEEQAEFISVIEKSSGNLLTIVNDILDLSKIKAQKINLENIDFDPIDSFEVAVESYAAKAAEDNIDFNLFVDPTLPTLLTGDPTKISQVIVNLVSNAMKFTSRNGEVNVNIENISESVDEVQVKFEVSDTGIGITKEQKSKIFEAFSQADVSTSREYGGTGLGLSISGKFVELMGGKLSIWSVKDKGSNFYFTLSLKKPESATRREVADMSAYKVGILNPHMDTEYIINKNLEAYIAYTGAQIEHYTDESLLALKGSSSLPDIIFIDHKFRFRGSEIEKFLDFDTKIVLMSTGDQKRSLKRYISRIDKILYKPINFTKTLKILNQKEDSTEKKNKITFENLHVLVAEDNIINQKLLLNVLNRLGIEVSIANNGLKALESRMKHEYDMIFMDIEMPVMGGMEATGQILTYERKHDKKHIPIVALTANALSGDREKYMGAGMDEYLSKPIHLDELNVLLERYFKEKIA